eukprot:TRINITY_DN1389_c0_g1_i1.p1 TRINITY_DN1389_c0_g1~~TRINITY_DN1389_c0_g1_i1.p1  ORF type:complete len:1390 (+),score=381.42 TRINITY_DN1389_c0_g1_i1:39-4172(+)
MAVATDTESSAFTQENSAETSVGASTAESGGDEAAGTRKPGSPRSPAAPESSNEADHLAPVAVDTSDVAGADEQEKEPVENSEEKDADAEQSAAKKARRVGPHVVLVIPKEAEAAVLGKDGQRLQDLCVAHGVEAAFEELSAEEVIAAGTPDANTETAADVVAGTVPEVAARPEITEEKQGFEAGSEVEALRDRRWCDAKVTVVGLDVIMVRWTSNDEEDEVPATDVRKRGSGSKGDFLQVGATVEGQYGTRWFDAVVVSVGDEKIRLKWGFDDSEEEVAKDLVRQKEATEDYAEEKPEPPVQLVISGGTERGRMEFELQVLNITETKVPGYFSKKPRKSDEGEGLGWTILPLSNDGEYKGKVIGKQGAMRKKISKASGTAIELLDNSVYIVGTGEERACAARVVEVLQAPSGSDLPTIPQEMKPLSLVARVPQEAQGAVVGKSRANLNTIEEESGTLSFFVVSTSSAKAVSVAAVEDYKEGMACEASVRGQWFKATVVEGFIDEDDDLMVRIRWESDDKEVDLPPNRVRLWEDGDGAAAARKRRDALNKSRPLVIVGATQRARCEALFAVMDLIEESDKMAGQGFAAAVLLSNPDAAEDGEDAGFKKIPEVSALELTPEEAEKCRKKGGATRLRAAGVAARCIMGQVGKAVYIAGSTAEQKCGSEFVRWWLKESSGFEVDERDDVGKLLVDKDKVGNLTDAVLAKVESETGTFIFGDDGAALAGIEDKARLIICCPDESSRANAIAKLEELKDVTPESSWEGGDDSWGDNWKKGDDQAAGGGGGSWDKGKSDDSAWDTKKSSDSWDTKKSSDSTWDTKKSDDSASGASWGANKWGDSGGGSGGWEAKKSDDWSGSKQNDTDSWSKDSRGAGGSSWSGSGGGGGSKWGEGGGGGGGGGGGWGDKKSSWEDDKKSSWEDDKKSSWGDDKKTNGSTWETSKSGGWDSANGGGAKTWDDPKKGTTPAASSTVELCGDFKKGNCNRGDRCRYSHGDGGGAQGWNNDKSSWGDDGAKKDEKDSWGGGKKDDSSWKGNSWEKKDVWETSVRGTAGNGGASGGGGEGTTPAASSTVELCGDFKRGNCNRGDRCRYSHGDGEGAQGGWDKKRSWEDSDQQSGWGAAKRSRPEEPPSADAARNGGHGGSTPWRSAGVAGSVAGTAGAVFGRLSGTGRVAGSVGSALNSSRTSYPPTVPNPRGAPAPPMVPPPKSAYMDQGALPPIPGGDTGAGAYLSNVTRFPPTRVPSRRDSPPRRERSERRRTSDSRRAYLDDIGDEGSSEDDQEYYDRKRRPASKKRRRQESDEAGTDEEESKILSRLDKVGFPESIGQWCDIQEAVWPESTPLPRGWIRIWSRSQRCEYYMRVEDQLSTFDIDEAVASGRRA